MSRHVLNVADKSTKPRGNPTENGFLLLKWEANSYRINATGGNLCRAPSSQLLYCKHTDDSCIIS